MLGEILGRIAGLTIIELFVLFFDVREDVFVSVLLFAPAANAGLVGELTALSEGLGPPYNDGAADGVTRGLRLGVPRAETRGVFASPSRTTKPGVDSGGCDSSVAASGSLRSSSIDGRI